MGGSENSKVRTCFSRFPPELRPHCCKEDNDNREKRKYIYIYILDYIYIYIRMRNSVPGDDFQKRSSFSLLCNKHSPVTMGTSSTVSRFFLNFFYFLGRVFLLLFFYFPSLSFFLRQRITSLSLSLSLPRFVFDFERSKIQEKGIFLLLLKKEEEMEVSCQGRSCGKLNGSLNWTK